MTQYPLNWRVEIRPEIVPALEINREEDRENVCSVGQVVLTAGDVVEPSIRESQRLLMEMKRCVVARRTVSSAGGLS